MSRIYYKQALYMKICLKGLILLIFLRLPPVKRLFLGHEEHPWPDFHNIYRHFSPLLQPKIRLSGRFSTIKSG